MSWTQSDIDRLKTRGFEVIDTTLPPKLNIHKSKFGNQKEVVDEITFDSKKEAKRYKELRMLLKAGEIGFLARQVAYELNVGGSHSLQYVADFVYWDSKTGKLIVEDTKGFKTREYRKKRLLMKKIHGIEILET